MAQTTEVVTRLAQLLIVGCLAPAAAACFDAQPDPCWLQGTCGYTADGGALELQLRIDLPQPYVTINPGEAVTLRSTGQCPADECSVRWDFGDGRTSTERDPQPVTYDEVGFYHVTLTATAESGGSTVDHAYVAVWEGRFSDDFDRQRLDHLAHGWRPPLAWPDQQGEVRWEIADNWLRTSGYLALPATTGLTAWPAVRDQHVEVTIKRSQQLDRAHFSDVLLRMHPLRLNGGFYRVRLQQEPAPGMGQRGTALGVEIAIFKITNPADEHGILLNDTSQPPATKPTNCRQCPYLAAYPLDSDLRLTIDLEDHGGGARFDVRLSDPQNPTQVLLSSTVTDSENPLSYAGFTGLTQFEGTTLFDDFVLEQLR